MSSLLPETAFTAEEIRQRKFTKKSLSLNLLLIGENGIGMKTFVNSLCKMNYFKDKSLDGSVLYNIYEERRDSSLKIETHTIDVVEPNTSPIRLRVSLTRNFAYNLDNSNNAKAIVDFILNEYDLALQEELKIKRNPRVADNRIHVGLYFLRAKNRKLNEFEIENMKKIGERINLIPVIGKADTLTEGEYILNKELISSSIKENNIPVFNFLEFLDDLEVSDDDIEEVTYLRILQASLPFGIIASNFRQGENFVRRVPWGLINIEDENNSDLKLLRSVLFGSHIQEFKDLTINLKYEKYRVEKLSEK
ncbi:Septin-type guanine nucleotide-binding (G) domain-containing protein [Scheffersomyces xylosifermentans]|uniref:Septin-type guanine nucleotide-binding (G) domain-containing protein n=1 Tax=Scheffersomyces xylosifermentans TaxID=1304137 RepID=UPI00315C9FAB